MNLLTILLLLNISKFLARFISHQGLDLIVNQFKRTNKRLLLLDYDGTLSPFFINPNQAIPNASLLQLLTNLTNDTKNDVVILSGRDKYTLDRWFAGINLQLAAEHGIWIKNNNNWQMSRPLTKEWHAQILPVLENFMDRLPGTFIGKKEFSIVWHYRGADLEKVEQLAKELTEHLVNLTANVDIQILLGNKIVEAKCAGVGKDTAALYFIAKNDYDFILAIGDDATDDDTFRVLPQHAYSIKVGINASHAKFNLRSQNDVITLLSRFV
jgi:trehalose 6-phosphate synthase/phosphatase